MHVSASKAVLVIAAALGIAVALGIVEALGIVAALGIAAALGIVAAPGIVEAPGTAEAIVRVLQLTIGARIEAAEAVGKSEIAAFPRARMRAPEARLAALRIVAAVPEAAVPGERRVWVAAPAAEALVAAAAEGGGKQ